MDELWVDTKQKLNVAPEVGEAFRRLTQSDSAVSWIAAGYKEGDMGELIVRALL